MSEYAARMTIKAGGEIFPGDMAPVVIGGNETRYMTWGFPDLAGKRPHINARSETAATSKTFGGAMADRRCLVPASGYFEWKPIDKRRKEKYSITPAGGGLMYMAGIYSPGGRFAILTCDAAPEIFAIHDRMPVILSKDRAAGWLNGVPDIQLGAISGLIAAPVTAAAEPPPPQMSLFDC